MSMHTDVADAISVHEITQKPLYRGAVYDFGEGLSDFAKGGQVVVSPGTLGRMNRDERRMHRASAALAAALAKGRQRVQRRQNAGLDLRTRIIKCVPFPGVAGLVGGGSRAPQSVPRLSAATPVCVVPRRLWLWRSTVEVLRFAALVQGKSPAALTPWSGLQPSVALV